MIKHESGEKKRNMGNPAFGEGDFFTDLVGQYQNGKHIILIFVTKSLSKIRKPVSPWLGIVDLRRRPSISLLFSLFKWATET